MRRWFMVFMLTLLPFQFSWAAVAAYCGHETASAVSASASAQPAAQHLGHHTHQHAGDAQAQAQALTHSENAAAPDDANVAAFDFDCGHCHSSCCSLPMSLLSLTPLRLSAQIAEPLATVLRTRAQVPPERPQWPPLA